MPFEENRKMVKDLSSFFYGIELGILILFLTGVWWLRPKSPESGFRVREADLAKKKPLPAHKSDLRLPNSLKTNDLKTNTQMYQQMYKLSMHGKPFEILGVSENATAEQVQTAYRNLIKIYHPDKLGHSPSQKVLSGDQIRKIAQALNRAKEDMLKDLNNKN